MNESFKPKSVAEFLNRPHHFRIPSFQRGYRWDTKQVQDLLEDIFAFAGQKGRIDSSYYLQPIVVRDISGQPDGNGAFPPYTWEVLDGQQRLTTMLLVLKNLIPYLSPKKSQQFAEKLYDITYSTRRNLNFDALDPKKDIDSYYLYEANTLIGNWMAERSESHPSTFDKVTDVLINSDADRKVCFIWYVVDDGNPADAPAAKREIESIKVFNRLNKGKIGLTSAELIKALFVLSGTKNGEIQDAVAQRTSMLKITMLWDYMEKRFNDDAFWYFIGGDSVGFQTRMDLLFDFVSGKKTGADSDSSYRWFQEKYDADPAAFVDVWDQVTKVFDELVHWYEDVTLYNYIGYLVTNGKTPLTIHNDLVVAKGKDADWNQEKTYEALSRLISEQLNVADLEALSYSDYDKNIIRKVLLLFNIEQYRIAWQRFPFDAYKKERTWDIEHVDSQTTNTMEEIADKIQWVESVLTILASEDPLEEASRLLDEGKELKKTLERDQKETHGNFTEFYKKVVAHYSRGTGFDTEGADKDSLGNLVLLDSATNRSYQNSPFSFKRSRIIIRDKTGKFVPVGTKNVFLKYYSGTGGSALDAMRWHTADKTNYMAELQRVLGNFLKGVTK